MKPDSYQPAEGPFVGQDLTDEAFMQIRDVLLGQVGIDIGMYKDQCIRRRIASRVRACGLARGSSYVERLRRDPDEAAALVEALAIHVSQFFRNPVVFARLEAEVLPRLIDTAMHRPEKRLRVWSSGCAGGEEPYSIALLLHDLAPPELAVEIIASDIGDGVLQQARLGSFDPVRLLEVPRLVQQRFFRPIGRQLQLREEIRSRVEFVEHNLLRDEFPGNIDLVLCRNVLIYFERDDQERILSRFASVLTDHGILVLGTTENLLGAAGQLFEPLHMTERIFRRLP